MIVRRLAVIFALLIFSTAAAGCGGKMDRMQMKQAKEALKSGNVKAAVQVTKAVLRRSPRNIFAKRLMSKLQKQLLNEARDSLEAKRYKDAVEKADMLLTDIDPQNEEAKRVKEEAKKYLLVEDARTALQKDNPMAALRMLKEALRLDPQYQEAKDLQVQANDEVEKKISNLMITAKKLIEEKKYEKLRDLAQDILSIDKQNAEAASLLREAQAQILHRNKEQNLENAKRFFDEGLYEQSLKSSEEVLKIDPKNGEARKLVEAAKAEMTRPPLRLTGFLKIKGMVFANIEMPYTAERYRVREGEEFPEDAPLFRVSVIDLDLKAVVVTYLKTQSQQTLTVGTD